MHQTLRYQEVYFEVWAWVQGRFSCFLRDVCHVTSRDPLPPVQPTHTKLRNDKPSQAQPQLTIFETGLGPAELAMKAVRDAFALQYQILGYRFLEIISNLQ